MQRTRHRPRSPRRVLASHIGRLALTAVTGTTISVVAPAVDAAADGWPGQRSCDAARSAEGATHTVADGEGWFSVAAAADVSIDTLLAENGARASDVLHPGDILCMPASPATAPARSDPAACASKHLVVNGDSWFGIAGSAGVPTSTLLKANDATSATVLHAGAEVCLPAGVAAVEQTDGCASGHTVAPGESWYVISRSTGVPMDALYAANKARASTTLFPGRNVCLPAVGFGRSLPGALLDAPPVRGACRFANSWMASRERGRLHVGVDLISPAGTPVVAVADGTLTRQSRGAASAGNAWWLTTSAGTYFFYAHLSGFASGLSVGSRVHAGQVIGYVGSTGNAVSPHLHFEVHPGGGAPTNPYSAIWMVGGCDYDRRYEQAPLS